MSEEIKYTETYEYILIKGDVGTIGISREAVDALGDIYLVDLPETGKVLKKNDAAAVVESVKSASDIFSPVSGQVVEVNDNLIKNPELISKDPLGEGWIFKIRIIDLNEISQLMNYEEFKKFINKES